MLERGLSSPQQLPNAAPRQRFLQPSSSSTLLRSGKSALRCKPAVTGRLSYEQNSIWSYSLAPWFETVRLSAHPVLLVARVPRGKEYSVCSIQCSVGRTRALLTEY